MTTVAKFQAGQRVTAVLWGQSHIGTVKSHNNGIVWVLWDGRKGVKWQHPDSLKLA